MNKNLCLSVFAVFATLFTTSAQAEEVSTKAADLMPNSSFLPTSKESKSSNLVAQNNEPLIGFTGSKQPASNYWYASGSLGAIFPNNVKVDDDNKLKLNSGFQLTAAGGYQWKNARAEAEVSFRSPGADKVSDTFGNESKLTGNVNQTTFLVNGYYDISTKSKLRPYVGAGIGFGVISPDIKFGGEKFEISSGTSFAYQGKVGVQYEVAKKGNAFVELKYLGIGGYTSKEDLKFGSFNSPALSIGYRQGF
ncbi:outer membrane protein [Dolichospermum flos-aquae]|uniref:Porin family protein n=1 Tax=Dolichospermum flos-aquae CCAP 1403/13F TaxID=315271 RepID=A0A6H2C1R2_DOLFA|nr:OmpW family outer membrane protein [Dolichospermum flos-aquae]QJB45447.1 porin family protein [Dolichospermum flos-aquae CCAP 1403/13F]